MDQYRHHVSGFFAHRAEAEGALSTLIGRGLGRDQLQLFDADSGPAISEPKGESNEVLTNVLVDGAIGTVVGTGIGALAQLAIVAGGVSLFVASPLVVLLVRQQVLMPASSTRTAGFQIWSMMRLPVVRWFWWCKPERQKKPKLRAR